MTGSPINYPALLQYCRGNQQLAAKLLAAFLQGREPYLAEIEQALLGRDADEIRAVCHKIKGAAVTLRADRLVSLVAQIRQYVIDDKMDEAQGCLPSLKIMFAEIEEFTLSKDRA